MKKHIPPKTVWELRKGHICYYADAYNKVKQIEWNDSDYLRCMRSIGLIALTKEELEFKIEKMKVYEELKYFAKEFTDEEWSDEDKLKCEININCMDFNVYISPSSTIKTANLYFESYKKAEQAINAVGEERVRKYYLEVEK